MNTYDECALFVRKIMVIGMVQRIKRNRLRRLGHAFLVDEDTPSLKEIDAGSARGRRGRGKSGGISK